jgi:hypothetical protein
VQIHEFLIFLSKKAAAAAPRRYSHSGRDSGSGSAAMDISVTYCLSYINKLIYIETI